MVYLITPTGLVNNELGRSGTVTANLRYVMVYAWRDFRQDRQCTHNNCCSGKAITITYTETMIVPLGIQKAVHMCHIAICGLPGSVIIFHIIS